MNVLQINSVVNTGSTGRIAEDIGLVLKAAGHESTIAYGRSSPPSKLKTYRIGDQSDIYLHGLKTLLTDRHGFGSKRSTLAFIEKIDALKPDAIGIHNLHGYYLNIRILFEYLLKKGIPVIWTFHDCWPFTGHCTYFDSVGCEKWKRFCNNCPKKSSYPTSLIADNSEKNFFDKKRLFSAMDKLTIVTPSIWLADLVKKSFFKDKDIRVINNGIDLDVFKPTKSSSNETKIILGVASIWDKRKGFDDFMKLRSLLNEEYSIVLIGLSDHQIKRLPSGIKGISRKENLKELTEWYSRALCFVNPTSQDNFPTTNIEALACGTPVITYDVGGSPEAIDEQTGRIVGKHDVEGLLKAIKHIEKRNRSEMVLRCRQRAEMYFNKNLRYGDYLELYEQVFKKYG